MKRLLLSVVVILNAAMCRAEAPLSWADKPGSLALMQGQEIVWQFNFDSQLSKPYFHPLNLPGGKTLTWASPPDHPWHYGLWFSWKFINGVNYWEEDRQTGHSDGRTTLRNIAVDQRPDFSARFELELEYHLPDQPPVLVEHRVIDVSPPRDDGGYSIDWVGTFVARAEQVTLDRTPVPDQPSSQVAGGYAGLSVRLAKEAAEFKTTSSQVIDDQQIDGDQVSSVQVGSGKSDSKQLGSEQAADQPERMRFRALSVDFSGSIDGTAGGITILDDPENVNSPSPWYVIRNTKLPMTFFSPTVIQLAPMKLVCGDSFGLHYRIVVHPSRNTP
ncbi:MAG: PmoA family protein [Pirellulaceae bacterium]